MTLSAFYLLAIKKGKTSEFFKLRCLLPTFIRGTPDMEYKLVKKVLLKIVLRNNLQIDMNEILRSDEYSSRQILKARNVFEGRNLAEFGLSPRYFVQKFGV